MPQKLHKALAQFCAFIINVAMEIKTKRMESTQLYDYFRNNKFCVPPACLNTGFKLILHWRNKDQGD